MKHGLLPILGLIFVTLKLCGVIDWSWWWVLSPFLGMAGLIVVYLGFLALVAYSAGVAFGAWRG